VKVQKFIKQRGKEKLQYRKVLRKAVPLHQPFYFDGFFEIKSHKLLAQGWL
jgi:hypothetical protein